MTIQEQEAYEDGAKAFRCLVPNGDNPHQSGRTMQGFNQLRYWWFMGWYDSKFAHLF